MTDFWAKRKAAVAEEESAVEPVEDAPVEDTRTDAEMLEELGLPEPETLDDSESLKAFLDETVPARLKTRALRRLWRVNPVLANLDGLIDYGEDYTDAATVVENLQTAYQVGKGMLSHIEEMARQAEAKALAQEQEDDAPEDVEPEPDVAVALDDAPEPEPFEDTEDTAEDIEVAELPANRRRMAFSFDEQRTG